MSNHLHIIAHRGGSEYAQANSLAAVKTAIKLGAKIIELDLRMTKDHQIVLSHDVRLSRKKLRRGDKISNFTFDELIKRGHHLTRFSEVLDIIPDSVQLDLDLKETKLINELIAELSEKRSTDQVIFDTNRLRVLKQIRQELPDAKVSLSTGGNHDPFNLSSKRITQFIIWLLSGMPLVSHSSRRLLKRKMNKLHPDSISVYTGLCNPNLVNFCHELGIKVFVYTINRPAELPRLIRMGVDGVKTDKPALIEQSLRKIYS